MKGVFSSPGDYIYFKSQVPLHKIPGYRVISVDIPRVWNHHEWIQAFEKFLDAIDVHHVHPYGTSLGGFLAKLFAQHCPRRVRSLVISNAYLETGSFKAAMPWAPMNLHVMQVETLAKDDLASRLTLTVDAASVGPRMLSDSLITIMDVKDQVSERYPGARRAYLKSGGDFPFLSRPDEVNLHLQLNLRRVGVEARPDLVQGLTKGDGGESSGEQDDGRRDTDDTTKDDKTDSAGPSTESGPPFLPKSTDSDDLDNQLLSNAEVLGARSEFQSPIVSLAFGEHDICCLKHLSL